MHLSTIGFSHYCEKARWALERAGLPFRESMHAPVFHILKAKRLAGGATLPVLRTNTGVYNDSTAILEQVQVRSKGWKPYPDDPEQRAEVERWEDRFDVRLGPHTRRLAYYHLLPLTRIAPLMIRGVGWVESTAFSLTAPLVRAMIRKGLRVDDTGAERSRAAIDEVFDEVDAALADGRHYLVGDCFTAADLTFAALAAPILSPAEYGFPLPRLETLTEDFQREVSAHRARPAGRFALRIYAEERGSGGTEPPTKTC